MIQPMKFKPRKTHPLHRLPYVGFENYVDRYGRIGYWDVPLAGGYNGGWQTGRALGNIAIKHMSQHDHDGDGGHLKASPPPGSNGPALQHPRSSTLCRGRCWGS